ncbi:MAG TPA: gliding motility-associated ABC transporter permease subunit GldF [Bacteroidia bacterium]|nr:gliding motility-associated ABC transporter permease subunit GldF [Bacteroidia bacterium]
MLSLLQKEINSFLNSLIGYIVILVFLLTIGLFLWVFPATDFNVFESGYANIDSLFIITPWVYMFLIPAITMRLFAEEKKSGTIELLLTRPLTELQVILAKYFAGVLLVFFSLLPTLVYYVCIYNLALPTGNVDSGAIWGSYLGLLFLGAGFTAIGVFASSLTDNQVIAFVIALFFCFICYAGFNSISQFISGGFFGSIIYNLGINAHYTSMSRGVIDTRDVIYFISIIAFFIMCTRIVLESRKW